MIFDQSYTIITIEIMLSAEFTQLLAHKKTQSYDNKLILFFGTYNRKKNFQH